MFSLRLSYRAQALAERQEKRRMPNLLAALLETKARWFRDGRREVSFELSVSNPTDADNAIATIDLRVRYRIDGEETTLKVRLSPEDGVMPSGGKKLLAPVPVPAHGTIQGWCNFVTPAGALSNREVQGHEVILIDTHGAATFVPALTIQAVAGD